MGGECVKWPWFCIARYAISAIHGFDLYHTSFTAVLILLARVDLLVLRQHSLMHGTDSNNLQLQSALPKHLCVFALLYSCEGGWCHEQNRLLCNMIRQLGFTAYEGFASVVTVGSGKAAEQPLQGLPTFQVPGATQELKGTHMVSHSLQQVGSRAILCESSS